MSVSENFKLEGDSLSFEGKVTSVTITDTGGSLNVSGKAGIYGSAYLTYNLTVNPNVKTQGSITGNAVDLRMMANVTLPPFRDLGLEMATPSRCIRSMTFQMEISMSPS